MTCLSFHLYSLTDILQFIREIPSAEASLATRIIVQAGLLVGHLGTALPHTVLKSRGTDSYKLIFWHLRLFSQCCWYIEKYVWRIYDS